MMFNTKQTVLTLAAVMGLGLALFAAQTSAAKDPKEAKNNTFITVNGTIVSASPSSFRLDYGSGIITVEMDDFDSYKEGYALLENDQVEVFGMIDDDLFEKRTIEASSVYVENLGTHFYASSADEEDFARWTVSAPVVLGEVEVTGEVTSSTGREFTIDTGLHRVKIDTSEMTFNPLDDVGYLKIDVGDRVKVGGDIDLNLFEKHEIDADWIIGLRT